MNENYAVKALGGNRIGWYLTLWGDPEHRDSQKQWFSPATKKQDVFFKAMKKLPIMKHHGLPPLSDVEVIGEIDIFQPDSRGIWVSGNLDENLADYPAIKQDIEAGKLYGSSGSASHLVKYSPEGHIDQWPVLEATLTPYPSDPRLRELPAQAIKSFYGQTYDELTSSSDVETIGPENGQSVKQDSEVAALKSRLAIELEILAMDMSMAEMSYNNILL